MFVSTCFRDPLAMKRVPFLTLILFSVFHVMLCVGVTKGKQLAFKKDTVRGQEIFKSRGSYHGV